MSECPLFLILKPYPPSPIHFTSPNPYTSIHIHSVLSVPTYTTLHYILPNIISFLSHSLHPFYHLHFTFQSDSSLCPTADHPILHVCCLPSSLSVEFCTSLLDCSRQYSVCVSIVTRAVWVELSDLPHKQYQLSITYLLLSCTNSAQSEVEFWWMLVI